MFKVNGCKRPIYRPFISPPIASHSPETESVDSLFDDGTYLNPDHDITELKQFASETFDSVSDSVTIFERDNIYQSVAEMTTKF